jgi:hypothetical protein
VAPGTSTIITLNVQSAGEVCCRVMFGTPPVNGTVEFVDQGDLKFLEGTVAELWF